jgi:glycosyltransferase involved in cell wall biosynthesis
MIYADQRWIGEHGIGRFAKHVLSALNYRAIQLDGHPAASLDAWHLTRALRKLSNTDLFFSPGYNTPLTCRAPFIFTIHDLSHVYCPENSSPLIRLYYSTILKRNCHRAAHILTVSEFTRMQIAEWAGILPEKIVNVSCGVDPAYRPGGDVYGFPFPYLLCVSNRKRHKNEFRIVEAFAKASISTQVQLVFTGQTTPELSDCIGRHGGDARVHLTGVVPEAQLPSLYRGALALVFPSLYEGFGLPVLEAMACGTPVVTSNVSAMPEVAADAALLVDPTSVDEIAQAMKQIVSDTGLRTRLREKGLARASGFSWDSTIAKVREVLALHMAEPNGPR